ncbi:MAG: thioredoxin [Actinomycetaceae bacterium]|nr:thioredoxin [Actinomycetaceae bacterium]
MATIELTESTFDDTIKEGTVLVDFWAPWCGPCRQFAPIFEKVSEAHADVVFAKVNTEEETALAASAQISAIPTLMAFRDGICIFQQAGALGASALESLIEKIQSLDMDEVRKAVAEQEAAEDSPASGSGSF